MEPYARVGRPTYSKSPTPFQAAAYATLFSGTGAAGTRAGASLATGTVRTSRPPLDAHLSACRDFSVRECAGSGLLPMLAGACRYSCAPALAGSVAAPSRD